MLRDLFFIEFVRNATHNKRKPHGTPHAVFLEYRSKFNNFSLTATIAVHPACYIVGKEVNHQILEIYILELQEPAKLQKVFSVKLTF